MIKVYAETTVTRLLKDGGQIAGAFGYIRDTGQFVLFEAPAVILATGGIGRDLQGHLELLGVHRRRARAGPAGRARRC